MTNTRSRIEDLRVVGLIVAITLGLSGAGWGVVTWVSDLMTVGDAAKAHAKLEKKINSKESKLHANETHQTMRKEFETHHQTALETNRQLLEEVKVIRQRTWELVQDKRGGR